MGGRAGAALVAALLLSTPAVSTAAKLPANHDLWVKVGRCEQPGNGYGGVNWSHPGPRFQGGLGFAASSWDYYKPKGFPADAGRATWRQQMVVANRLWRMAGWGWGCDLR